ncbi:hypothetical protein [Pseudonocardia sp.]|uniref:hypothetical protein n=1 Tax=Pseudonocardia sp. TaxID=60912 RepID=UPI0031FDE125
MTWEDSRLLAAPLRTVWQLHTDINSWPTWNGEVFAARLDGPLAAPSSFTATTAAGLLADTDLRPRCDEEHQVPGKVSQVASRLHEAVERWLDQLQPEAESPTSPNA